MAPDIPTTRGGKPTACAEPKSKDSKSGSQKRTQIIMGFLSGCTPYESDALRAMLAVADGKSTTQTMPQYDRTAINRFLDFGCGKETAGVDAVRAHRQARALELMKYVSQYVGKDEIITVTSALITIASDRKDMEYAVSSLPKQQT